MKNKRKINGSYFNFSFEVDVDLEKLRDGNFCLLKTLDLLKTTVKTAVKTLAFVWINSPLLMRINEINIRASFLSVVI